MGKTKFFLKFTFDAPVTLVFVLISLILSLLNLFVFKGSLTKQILASPTNLSGSLPFLPSSIMSYFRLFSYVFGAKSISVLISNLILVLILGPAMEERYGSVVIGIMMIVSSIFSGVLNACFASESLEGSISIIFMFIFLNSFMSFSKKKVPVSFVAVFVLFVLSECLNKNFNEIIGTLIAISGGLCGSLFAFLTSPKAKAEKKSSKGGLLNKAEKVAYLEELDSQSPRNKNNRRNDDDDDETTVVGTLKF